MVDDKLNLLEYLPDYLKTYKELQQIMGTESIELQKLEDRHQNMIADGFIASCGSYGISRFEKLLGIVPLADDTLDTRKFRVQSKWNNRSPYHYAYLEEQLTILCGSDGYAVLFDREKQKLTVKVELVSKNMLDSVEEFLQNVVPCNLILETGLLYNQYSLLERFTYGELENFTYGQLREDVIA